MIGVLLEYIQTDYKVFLSIFYYVLYRFTHDEKKSYHTEKYNPTPV